MNQNQLRDDTEPRSVDQQQACSASFAAWLHDYFRAMRFDPSHHLGLGDIRLTLGQQDDLVVAAERAHVGKPNVKTEARQ